MAEADGIDERYIGFLTVGGVERMGPIAVGRQPPTDVITLKLNIDVTGGEIQVIYSGIYVFKIGANDNIDDYLKQIARYPNLINWEDPVEKDPDKTISNLSIRHNGYSYIVMVLDEKNWQFTESNWPFMVETGKSQYYLDTRCAFVTSPLNADVKEKAPRKSACKVASFIADSAGDPANNGSDFHASFNIFLDLRLKKAGKRRLLPIALDPDVGYPGGNTVGP